MWQDIPSEAVGGLGLAMMLILMAIKIPIGAAMMVPGILGIWAIIDWNAAEGVLRRMPYEVVASWSLSVLPMFIFMGMLLWRSGVTEHLYTAARQWVGRLPGGLAAGTNLAGAGFAAVTGSSIGTAYAVTRAGVPEMLKAGYDRRLAMGSVLAAGTLANLIPPSILLVIYAGLTEVPVGPQLLAGLGPGILLAIAYCVAFIGISTVKRSVAGGSRAHVRASVAERVRTLGAIWPVPVLLVLIVGGMFVGIFTPTEAGAAGALGALLIAVWGNRKGGLLSAIREPTISTVATVGALFFLVIGAHILSQFLSVSGLAASFVELIEGLELARVEFLLIMLAVYLVLGMAMDPLTMMLVTVPILLPIFDALSISPIWFGVFVVLLGELAIITPPVGLLCYVVHGIVQDRDVNIGIKMTLGDVFQAVFWLLPVPLLIVGVMIFFPDVVLWIPEQMSGN